jgi:hypothetical protein
VQISFRGRMETHFAHDPAYTGVPPFGMRQVLPSDARSVSIRRHQKVAIGSGTVFKMSRDPAAGADFIALERLVEMHRPVHPVEQQLSQ